jgi:predicted aspartyl protease
MAKIYPFKLESPDDVIIADVLLGKHKASLVVDTGATHTVIDLNSLIIAGYSFTSKGRNKFETANGVIECDIIKVDSLMFWGKEFKDVDIFTIDLIAAGMISPYEGVLGLDLMKNFTVKIDFKNSCLELTG